MSVGFLTKHEQQKEKLTERLFALDKEKLDLRYAVESLNKEINDYQKELMGYPDTAAIDKKLQDVKTQLAKLHEQEQTLYGRLKETESEVSRLRGQTKGCELALREAEARLAKAADIWQEKSGGTPFEKASEVKASILDRDDLARLKEDIQMHWDQTKQCESISSGLRKSLMGDRFLRRVGKKPPSRRTKLRRHSAKPWKKGARPAKLSPSSARTIKGLRNLKHHWLNGRHTSTVLINSKPSLKETALLNTWQKSSLKASQETHLQDSAN